MIATTSFRSFISAAVCGILVSLTVSGITQGEEVRKGQQAPDFTVTGIDGKGFKLSEVLATGKNVVLVFDRAHW